MNILELESLQITLGDKLICRALSLTLSPGECMAVLGVNGVGKTTLLYSIVRLRRKSGGHIRILDQEVEQLGQAGLARRTGLLFQESAGTLPATVLETALLGRHPFHAGKFWDQPEDLEMAHKALTETGLQDLQDRQIQSLSGGERQRVAIATLLVQSPQLMLLDEPSNHLDIDSQIRLLALLQSDVRRRAGAMLMATHDINLAYRFCDSVLLMLREGEFILGEKSAVLTCENLSRAFGCRIESVDHATGKFYFPA